MPITPSPQNIPDYSERDCPIPGWRFLGLHEYVRQGDAYYDMVFPPPSSRCPESVRNVRIGYTMRELYVNEGLNRSLAIMRREDGDERPVAFRYPLNAIQSEPLPLP